MQPNPSSVVNVENDADTVVSPTSLLNSWKPPRKRKESTLMMSQVKFEKHVYGKKRQYDIQSLETFDPRPAEYRGTATASLNKFIETTKGRWSCVSLLFDESTRVWLKHQLQPAEEKSLVPTEYNICSKEIIQSEVAAFKESLKIDEAGINGIERETREQTKSHNWYHLQRLRLTASHFGEILRRRPSTKPDALVKKILGSGSSNKVTPSMEWGIHNESVAFELYKQKKMAANTDIVVTKSGLWISLVLVDLLMLLSLIQMKRNHMALPKLNAHMSIEIIPCYRLAKTLTFAADLLRLRENSR